MLQVLNRLLIVVSLIIYFLLLRLLILPAVNGIKSSQQIERQYHKLNLKQSKRLVAMNQFKGLEKKWGAKIHLSQSVLLPFLLTQLEKTDLQLVDFTEQDLSKQDSAQVTKQYLIQLKGPTEPTLILLNALEQEFPFATIQNLILARKTIRKKNVLITQFYFEQ